jgi:hypothetical protein
MRITSTAFKWLWSYTGTRIGKSKVRTTIKILGIPKFGHPLGAEMIACPDSERNGICLLIGTG